MLQHIVIDDLITVHAAGQMYYDNSMVVKYNVLQVPLKPDIDEKTHPEWFKSLAAHSDGLRYLHPKSIQDVAVGTNVDFLKYFKSIHPGQVSAPVLPSSSYRILNTDMNIYQRINKVYIYMYIRLMLYYNDCVVLYR